MPDLPPKPSMAQYALGVMRQLLDRGEWNGYLPGERALALRLGVSRPTLHQALTTLEAEGVLARRLKSTWRILSQARPSTTRPRKVIFLSPLGLEDLDQFTLHQYAVLAGHLAERGFELEPMRLGSGRNGRSDAALKALANRLRPSAWVLHRCAPSIQQWFGQSGLAAVVMGSASAKLRIRSVDVDYRAAARHAVSQLLRLGHQVERIAYLMPAEKLIGHAEALAGMRQAAGGAEPRVVAIPEAPEPMRAMIDELLREAPAPTALVLHRPLQALTVLSHLAWRGVRVPTELSLIVLDDNPVLAHVTPHPSRYHKDTAQFAAHLRKAIEHATDRSSKGAWSTRIVPELIAGETLDKPPGKKD